MFTLNQILNNLFFLTYMYHFVDHLIKLHINFILHFSPSDYNSIEEFAALWDDKPFIRIPLRLTLEHAAFTRLKFLRQYQFRDRVKAMLHFSGFQYDVVCLEIIDL